jgi:hypothetical protein
LAGELTRAGQRRALDAGVGKAISAFTTVYVGLATADPGKNPTLAGVSEITTAGYARQAVTLSAASDADPSVVSNSGILTFGAFTADPPSISHCFLTDAATGTSGSIVYKWTLDTPRDPGNGDSVQFAAGALICNLD